MSTTQIIVALIPVALVTIAIAVAALLEPWRARRAPGNSGRGSRNRHGHA
jgi:hypothetical protein